MTNQPIIRTRAPIGGQPQGGQPQGGRPQGQPIQQGGPGRIQPQGLPQPAMKGRPAPQGIQPRAQARPAAGVHGYQAIKDQQDREAREAARKAQERAEGYMPQEFFLSSPDKRGVRQDELAANIVILDHEPSFAIHEHNFPDPKTGKMGKGSFRTICLAGEGPCPACEVDQKEAYYALKLTVMDMRPYTSKDNQLVPHSRKLLTVKQKNQPYFFRMFERHGTLRGMQLFMIRDDPRGASHGNPEFVELHSEETIMATFQHGPVMSRGGNGQPPRLLKEANADCFAFDYDRLYPRLTYEELAEKVGLAPQQGYGQGSYGGYGQQGGYDQNWGNDAQQFNSIQPRRIGMAPSGGIQARPIGNGGQINNRMAGDGYDQYSEDDQYEDQGQQHDQGHGGHSQGVTSNGQTFDLDDEIPFDQGVQGQEVVYADEGYDGQQDGYQEGEYDQDAPAEVAPAPAQPQPQVRTRPAPPQIAARQQPAQQARPIASRPVAQRTSNPAGAGVTDPDNIPL